MSMTLDQVLRHPSVLPGEPALLTDAAHGSRAVRWIHSSEVVDIAPLLRGGELLLTGGLVLSDLEPARQRAYVRDLAAQGVTAVAVETTSAGAGLPETLVDEAHRQDFPLIQLDRTVPFVEVAESVNGLLINDSVHRLRLADSLSDTLSTQLTSGATVQQLAETLAASTTADVAVRDTSGELLAAAPESRPRSGATPRHTPITVHGVTTALLELHPSESADPPMVEAALGRAPQAFGLALLRTRPPSAGTRAARALFSALQNPTGEDLIPLLEALGLSSGDTFAAVAATHADPGFPGVLEHIMRRGGRHVVSRIDHHEYLALVTLEAAGPHRSRTALVDDLRQSGDHVAARSTIAVGPLVPGGRLGAHALAEARRCLDPSLRRCAVGGVVDAESCSLHRLVHRLDADESLAQFVGEQLGSLLRQPPETRRRLLHTLEVFFDCATNKTETAQRLHVRRQTLYQRLDKLSQCLGREVTAPGSLADLQVAVRLHQVLEGATSRSAARDTSSAMGNGAGSSSGG